MENESILTNAAEPVVEAQVAAESVAEGETTAPDTQEVADPARQTKGQNHAAAVARKAGYREAEEAAAKQKEATDRLMAAIAGMGYRAQTPEELAELLEAENAGMELDAYREQQRQEKDALQAAVESDPRYIAAMEAQRQLEERDRERVFAEDLAAIKKAHPELNNKGVDEFGPAFFNARVAGIDPVTAYEIWQAAEARNAPPKPPTIGAANTGAPAVKDFYTSDEVDRLTQAQLDDPKVMEAVMKSMKKW